jgi:hypothetical protein
MATTIVGCIINQCIENCHSVRAEGREDGREGEIERREGGRRERERDRETQKMSGVISSASAW